MGKKIMAYILCKDLKYIDVERLRQRSATQWFVIQEEDLLNPDPMWANVHTVIEHFTSSSDRKIFVPFYSKKIPKEIYEKYEVIIFHMTDVPYGRGGSPLQNLIKRGHSLTKIAALQCTDNLDAGDVYLKEMLSLDGTAEEIYKRAGLIIEDMMWRIAKMNIVPKPQIGTVTKFKRRKPAQSEIVTECGLTELYDHIRMLDAPDYPKAFVEYNNYRLEFTGARLENGKLTANVEFVEDE